MRPEPIDAAPRFDDGDPHLIVFEDCDRLRPRRDRLRPLGLWRALSVLRFLPPPRRLPPVRRQPSA